MATPPNAFASDPSFNRYKGSYFNNDVDVSGGNIICRNGNLYLASNSSIYSPTNQINFDDTYQYLNCLQNLHVFGNTICGNNITLEAGNLSMPNNSNIQTSGNSITFDDSYNFINIPNNFHIYQQFQLDYGGTTYNVGDTISNIGDLDYNPTYTQHTLTNLLVTGMLQIRDALNNDINLTPKLRDLYSGIIPATNVSNTFSSQQNFNSIRVDGSLILNAGALTLSNANLQKISFISNVVSDVNTSLANRVDLASTQTITGAKQFTSNVRIDAGLLLNGGLLTINQANLQKLQFISTISSDIQTQTTTLATKLTDLSWSGTVGNYTTKCVSTYFWTTGAIRWDGNLLLNNGTLSVSNAVIQNCQYLTNVTSSIGTSISTLNTKTTNQSYNSGTNTTTFSSSYLVGQYLHAQSHFRMDGALYLNAGALFIPNSTVQNVQYLSGLTSNVNTSLTGKVNNTGDETIGGVKTFSSAPVMSGAGISAGTISNLSLANTFFDIIANNTLSGQNTFSTTGTTTYNGDIRLDGNLKVGTAGGTIITNSSLAFLSGISEGVQSAINTLKDKVNNVTRSTTTTSISGTTACDSITFTGTLNSISTTVFGYLSGVSSSIQTQLTGLQNQINSLNSTISGIDSSLPPIGSIIFHLSNGLQTADPSRFILADGGYYSRTTYSILFGYIGTTFGSSNASNFRVPDYRSVFLRCAGSQTISGTYYVANAIDTPQQDAMIAHTHAAQSGQYLGNTLVTEALQGNRYATGVTRPQVYNFASTGSAQGTGVRTSADENRPVNYSCYYYIRAY